VTKAIPSEPDTSPPDTPQVEEFSSWKEIAAYLGISVRRAQQWETELGLPVERFATNQRARVRARRSEIDRWRRERTEPSRPLTNGTPSPEPVLDLSLPPAEAARRDAGSGTGAGAAWTARTRRRAAAVVAVLPLLAVASWFAWSALHPAPGPPASAGIVNGELQVLDGHGAPVWRTGFPEGPARLNVVALPPEKAGVAWRTNTTLVQDVDGDGKVEVLFVLSTTMGNGAVLGNRLICYDAGGTERWRYAPGRKTRWQDRQFDAAYSIWWVLGPFSIDGKRRLLVSASNSFFPCQISLLDAATGRLVGEYWHFGALLSGVVFDANGDDRLEVFAGGVNNPGPGNGSPALVELDLPLPAPRPAVANVFDSPPVKEVAYLLFPPVDAFALDPYPAAVTWIRLDDWGRLQLAVSQGHNYPSRGQVYYTLDSHIAAVEARADDLLKAYHEDPHRAGRIDHRLDEQEMQGWRGLLRFETMPNANSPAITSRLAARPVSVLQSRAPGH
jgi:hypothetical protein